MVCTIQIFILVCYNIELLININYYQTCLKSFLEKLSSKTVIKRLALAGFKGSTEIPKNY